ncbi:MAG: GNAT family N-acetyltransferase [Actinomycetota bacterium]
MHIRPATEADLDDLLALWRELEEAQGRYRLFPPVPDAADRIEASFRESLTADDADVLLVFDGETPVAMGLLHVEYPSRMSSERSVELSRVVVRADRRGRGIGKALIGAAAQWARDRRVRHLNAAVFVANEASRRFWRGAGFEVWVERMVRPVDPPGAQPDG